MFNSDLSICSRLWVYPNVHQFLFYNIFISCRHQHINIIIGIILYQLSGQIGIIFHYLIIIQNAFKILPWQSLIIMHMVKIHLPNFPSIYPYALF
jgi:hypothetical protein